VLLGAERRDLARASFSKFISEKDSGQWHQYFVNVLNNEEKLACMLTLNRRDGSVFPAWLEGIRTTGSDGAITVRIAFNDITDIRRAEDALRQANKKLHLLSSITRHDIKNQLLTIDGFLVFLKKKVPDPALEEHFNRITTASTRISSMIQFTKTYENIGVNAPVWQDCRKLVETAVKDAPLGKVTAIIDLPAGAAVYVDPLILKVFYNLAENAARYGEKIKTIRFSGEECGGDYLIFCKDDGIGIPAGVKEKIFERGFGQNTGLGLFLAREILDITGITIKETGEPGKGARFEMTVPKGAWRMGGN
jgi:signal transduction histidine kinase